MIAKKETPSIIEMLGDMISFLFCYISFIVKFI